MGADVPWYRHRWPWFLMAGPGIVIVAGIATAWLAIKSNDGLVADDYYKQGLAINQQMAKSARAKDFGLRGDAKIEGGRAVVHLEAASGVVLPSSLKLRLVHPTVSGHDQQSALTRQGDAYEGSVDAGLTGHWQVLLDDEQCGWRLTGQLSLPDQSIVKFE